MGRSTRTAWSVVWALSLSTLVNCKAPDRPRTAAVGTGGAAKVEEPEPEPPCFCKVLERTAVSIKVSTDCLCDHFGCPTGTDHLREPTGSTVSTIECGDRITFAHSDSLAGAAVHTFSKTTGERLGSEYMADFPAYCEAVSVTAGDVMMRDNECGADWCILSHGLDQVAAAGECLDPSVVQEPPWVSSSGGNAGGGGMGGGP